MSVGTFGAAVAPPVAPLTEPSHTQIQQQFAPYLANELAPPDQARVGRHLRRCPACATALVNFLQELHATTELLGSLPPHPASRALRERLLAIPDCLAASRE